jgi:hypothetical protein
VAAPDELVELARCGTSKHHVSVTLGPDHTLTHYRFGLAVEHGMSWAAPEMFEELEYSNHARGVYAAAAEFFSAVKDRVPDPDQQ